MALVRDLELDWKHSEIIVVLDPLVSAAVLECIIKDLE